MLENHKFTFPVTSYNPTLQQSLCIQHTVWHEHTSLQLFHVHDLKQWHKYRQTPNSESSLRNNQISHLSSTHESPNDRFLRPNIFFSLQPLNHPSMLAVVDSRGYKTSLTFFFSKRVEMDEKQLNHPERKHYFWNRAASSPFSAMDEIISQPPTSSPPMKIWGNVGQLLYVFRVSLSPWLCSSSSTSTVTKSAPCASKIPTTLCENPHWGALLDPLMKATTLFSFTNRSINCSSGTVSWTWRPGVNRKSGGLWGAPTQVLFPATFPGGALPVASICSCIHDFQALLRAARSGVSSSDTATCKCHNVSAIRYSSTNKHTKSRKHFFPFDRFSLCRILLHR